MHDKGSRFQIGNTAHLQAPRVCLRICQLQTFRNSDLITWEVQFQPAPNKETAILENPHSQFRSSLKTWKAQTEAIRMQSGRRETGQSSSHDTGNTDCTTNCKNRK